MNKRPSYRPGKSALVHQHLGPLARELERELAELRKDKDRLDSGVMVYTTFDEFCERIKVESRGNDLRSTIDEGIALRDRNAALASKEGA